MLGAQYTRFNGDAEGGTAVLQANGRNMIVEENSSSSSTPAVGADADGNATYGADAGTSEACLRASNFFAYDAEAHEAEEQLAFADPGAPPSTRIAYLQWWTRRVVEHLSVRVFTLLLILADTVLLLMDLFSPTHDPAIEWVALAFSIYFAVEVTARMFGLGLAVFFRAWYNKLDWALVVITLVLSIVTVCVESVGSSAAGLIVSFRLIRFVRISRLIWQQKHIMTGARQFVSQNKRRFQQDGFDLDLTYVTPKVIAMSFPSTGKMAVYRNDIKEVARFLDTRHPSRYRVYNLCSERHYNEDHFHGAVERYHVNDHNVPALSAMLEFSASVSSFLSGSEADGRVVAVHCKGGKGRTGTMICVCLIDSGVFKDAEHCLGYFGQRRTDTAAGNKFQGVETPSQSRYVGYYERVVTAGRVLPPSTTLRLMRVVLEGMGGVGHGTAEELVLSVGSRGGTLPYRCCLGATAGCKRVVEGETVSVELLPGPDLRGDTKVMFTSSSRRIPRGYDNCPFFFWFHTSFITNNRLQLHRHELDNPHKSKTWRVFKENFSVTLYFESCNRESKS